MTRPIETLTATWTRAGWWLDASPPLPMDVARHRSVARLSGHLGAAGWWYAAALGDGAHLFQREAPGP